MVRLITEIFSPPRLVCMRMGSVGHDFRRWGIIRTASPSFPYLFSEMMDWKEKSGSLGTRGKQGRRAHRMASKRGRRAKMIGRTLLFIVPRLSPEQREQVRKIRLNMRRRLNTNSAQLKTFRLDMREAFWQFPVKQDDLKAIFDQMAKLRNNSGIEVSSGRS